jgi:oligopeptidase B
LQIKLITLINENEMKHLKLLIKMTSCAFLLGACKMKLERDGLDDLGPEKKMKVFRDHGYKREDPYYWLKERQNPAVLEYLKRENVLSDRFFKENKSEIDSLFEELKSRTPENEDSAPITKGQYIYSSRYRTGLEHPQHVRRTHNLKNSEEIILDENELARNSDFMDCAGPYLSPDQNWIAYGVDLQGRRFYNLFFKNLKTGKISDFKIENVTGNIAWASDNETIFYTKQDPDTLRSFQLFRFHLPDQKNEMIYEEKDSQFSIGISRSLSGNYLFLNITHLQSNEVRFVKADQPKSDFKTFRPRLPGVSYYLIDGGDSFYLLTDENAPNKKLYKVEYQSKSEKDWIEVLPHRPDVFIADVDAIQGYLIITERILGLNEIRLIDEKTLQSRYLKFEDATYTVGTQISGEFKRKDFRIVYESPRVPEKIIDVHLSDLSQHLVKQRNVPHFDAKNYRTERVWIKARDGQSVPISLVMKKDFKPDGKSPFFQYGYGSYGYAIQPFFSLASLSLVDRGFVFGIAHIRGGDDLGRAWYDGGRMKNKMNTFNDFIDLTEGMIEKGYAQKGHVYARGGSAGGLLMGAVANMRPDLYRGIIAEVPFVDVLNTMLDDSIPLTTSEYEEWGNPHIKEQYDWMAQYSPYDNVKKQAYPNMLIRTGLHDSQVQYWEPAKWLAKLHDMNTSNNLLLLSTNMEAGHGGVTGRYKQLKEEAESLSFALVLEKMAPAQKE